MRKTRNAKGCPEREHYQYVLFPNIQVCSPSSTSKVWHNNSIYHLLILCYFRINPSFWCNNSLRCDTTLIFLCSGTRTVLRQDDRCTIQFIVTSAMTQQFSPQTEIIHRYPASGCQQNAHTRLGHLLEYTLEKRRLAYPTVLYPVLHNDRPYRLAVSHLSK